MINIPVVISVDTFVVVASEVMFVVISVRRCRNNSLKTHLSTDLLS